MEVDGLTESSVGSGSGAIGWNLPKIEESSSGNETIATGMKR